MPQLMGKIYIVSNIEVKTGLRVGGAASGLKIGGVDAPVIVDAYGVPYIPGSSLKGKLRSLMELALGLNPNTKSGLHQCDSTSYENCIVCKIWGISGAVDISDISLTRLYIRDTYLDKSSITDEMKNLELQYTEIKIEINIDRRSGTVSKEGGLRFIERVPAGAIFKNCEMIYNVYEEEDKNMLQYVFKAMQLLEHDYLGGMGSRGYGKVEFKDIKVFWNSAKDYQDGKVALTDDRKVNDNWDTPLKLIEKFEDLKKKITLQ